MFWLVCKVMPGTQYRQTDELQIDRDARIDYAYTSETAAHAKAQELAIQKPTTQYAVLAVTKVYETTTPKVISKKLDGRGQLVLDEGN